MVSRGYRNFDIQRVEKEPGVEAVCVVHEGIARPVVPET